MSPIARLLPATWTLLCAAAAVGCAFGGYGIASAVTLAGAAWPLARDLYGRPQPHQVFAVFLTSLWCWELALGRGDTLPPEWAVTLSAAILGVGALRQMVARVRHRPLPDEPEDLLALALTVLVWPAIWPAAIALALPLAGLWYAVRPWVWRQDERAGDRRLRWPTPVAARLDRCGCWSGLAAWHEPSWLMRLLLAPGWWPLWLAAPRRAASRAWLDRQVESWRRAMREARPGSLALAARLAYGAGPVRLAGLPELAARSAASRGDPVLQFELLVFQQTVAMDFGQSEQAIAAGLQLAAMAQAGHATARRQRLANQAIGETALAYARLEATAEADRWRERLDPDPVLDRFLDPLLALLMEPPEARTDALFRAVRNLPWAEQDPPSAPLRRWQRLGRLAQVRQRLDAGHHAAGAAQDLGPDDLPDLVTPADEAILRARLSAQEGFHAAARQSLTALLQRPGLAPRLAAEARRELAALTARDDPPRGADPRPA